MQRHIFAPVLAMLVGAVGLTALACGQPAPAGPSAEEIRAIVQQEVQNAPAPAPAPAGPSAEEIQKLVETAVMEASESEAEPLTASQVQNIVAAAVAAIPQPEPGADPLTASEIEAIVESAVDAIPQPEPGADPLTAEEVQDIVAAAVESAVADLPAPEPMMSGPTGDPIKIGTILDYTGDLGIYGSAMRNGADIAAEIINEAGGVLGRPVQQVHKDGGTSSQISTDAARALVTTDGIQAIVGALSSGVTIAVANSVTVPNEVLLVSPSATSPAISILNDNDFVFRTAVSDAAQGVVLARLANELGYETAATIYVNNPYGEGLSRVFTENFEAMGGSVIAAVPQESGQPSYQSEIENAVGDDPDVLIAMSYPESTQVYVRQALEGDYIDTFMFVDANKSQEIFDTLFEGTEGSDAIEGSFGTAPGAQPTDESAVFSSIYEQRYGALNVEPFIGETFDAFIIVALAIEKAGVYEATAIRDALREVSNAPGTPVGPGNIELALQLIRDGKDIDYQGVAGDQDFDANGDVVNTIEIWKIEDGKVVSTGRYESP